MSGQWLKSVELILGRTKTNLVVKMAGDESAILINTKGMSNWAARYL